MKKKLIEAMDNPEYIKGMKGVVAVVRSPEKGLITLDVMEVKTRNVKVRVCLTDKEYANYYPESGMWDGKQIDTVFENNRWGMGDIKIYNIPVLEKAFERKDVREQCWLYEIKGRESLISYGKRKRSEDRKEMQCQQRNNPLPDITDEERKWLINYVEPFHFLYYKRHGRYADIACSNCGKSGTVLTNPVTLEEYAKRNMPAPRHMEYTNCPWCGRSVQCRSEGRSRNTEIKEEYKYILYPDGMGSVVIRYFEIWKACWGSSQKAGESIHVYELARVWNLNGKQQKDWNKGDEQQEDWDYKNICSMNPLKMKTGKVYRGNLDFLKETDMKYACIDQALANNDYENMEEYIGCYNKYPIMEMLTKLGMTKMRQYVLNNWRWTEKLDPKGKTPAQVFRVTKQRFADLKRNNGGIELLELYQLEEQTGKRFTPEEERCVNELELSLENLRVILQYAKPVKLLNYIKKQIDIAGADYIGADRQNETAALYVDYVKMCVKNERDMTNPHKVYPENLVIAHDREYMRMNNLKQQKEKEEKTKRILTLRKKQHSITEDIGIRMISI